MSDAAAVPPLTTEEAEGFAQFLAGLQALACEPVEVLVAAGLALAGAALLLPLADEGLARALPLGLALVVALLGGLLARLGRGDA